MKRKLKIQLFEFELVFELSNVDTVVYYNDIVVIDFKVDNTVKRLVFEDVIDFKVKIFEEN